MEVKPRSPKAQEIFLTAKLLTSLQSYGNSHFFLKGHINTFILDIIIFVMKFKVLITNWQPIPENSHRLFGQRYSNPTIRHVGVCP